MKAEATDNRRIRMIIWVLILEVLSFSFLNWKFGGMHLDSDDSAELRLGEVLSREGGVLSDNWYYSTELRVLYSQLVTSNVFRFRSGWRTVRVISTAILLSFLVASFLYLCRSLNLGNRLVLLAPLILWPFSRTYLDIVLFGTYYVAPISIIFITLGLCLNRNVKGRNIRLIVLATLSLLSGMGGIRMPVICAVPILIRSSAALLPKIRSEKGVDSWPLITATVTMAATFLGYRINLGMLSRRYSVMSWSAIDPQIPGPGELVILARESLRALGVLGFPGPTKRIMNVLMRVMYCIVLFMDLRMLRKWKELSQEEQILLSFFAVSFLTTISGPLLTTQGYADRYLLMPFMGILVAVAIYFEHYPPKSSSGRRICAFMRSVVLLAGISYLRWFVTEDKLADKRPAFEYILDSGMSFGFGDWDTSDVLTEMSDGRVRTCKITNFKNPDIWHWLMEKDFTKYAHDGPIFLIMDNDRLTFSGDIGHVNGEWKREDLGYLDRGEIVFSDERYTVWRYESIEAFSRATGQEIA